MKLYTIGSNGKNLRRFAQLLREAGVDCLIDVRLNNTSQLAGFAKRDDLEFSLELLGIRYEHHPELAPDDELLARYKKGKDWHEYFDGYARLIGERGMLSVGRKILNVHMAPCLLCAEDNPEHCHRRLLAEAWAAEIPDVEVEHLR